MIPSPDFTAGIDEVKSYRKELKMKPSVAAAIRRAAEAVGMDMSTFMASTAFRAATEIERARFQTHLPDEAFDTFATAVDRPGQANATLTGLFRLRAEHLRDG